MCWVSPGEWGWDWGWRQLLSRGNTPEKVIWHRSGRRAGDGRAAGGLRSRGSADAHFPLPGWAWGVERKGLPPPSRKPVSVSVSWARRELEGGFR